MGLDGIFRKALSFYGINAAKGRWLNEHNFALERRILGHSENDNWVLTFDGDKVTMILKTPMAPRQSCTACEAMATPNCSMAGCGRETSTSLA